MPDQTPPEDDDVREDDAPEATDKPAANDKTAATKEQSDDFDAEGSGSSRSPSVIAVIAMLVAIATLGASAYMWRNPVATEAGAPTASGPPPASSFTQEERDQAKAKLCDAYSLVSVGVANSSAVQPERGQGDYGDALAVAANARLALLGGGQFLLSRIDPATPDDLAEAANNFGNTLMDVGAAAIAEIPSGDAAQDQRLKDADAENNKLDELCNPEDEPAPPASGAPAPAPTGPPN